MARGSILIVDDSAAVRTAVQNGQAGDDDAAIILDRSTTSEWALPWLLALPER